MQGSFENLELLSRPCKWHVKNKDARTFQFFSQITN